MNAGKLWKEKAPGLLLCSHCSVALDTKSVVSDLPFLCPPSILFGGLLIIVGCILNCGCLRNCVSVGMFGCTDMTADT